MPGTDKMSSVRNRKTQQSASSRARSRSSNSRKPTWISPPPSYRQSQSPDGSTTTPMRSTTSRSSAISRGTRRSTEAGTLAHPQISQRATTAPVQDSVGPSAIDNRRHQRPLDTPSIINPVTTQSGASRTATFNPPSFHPRSEPKVFHSKILRKTRGEGGRQNSNRKLTPDHQHIRPKLLS